MPNIAAASVLPTFLDNIPNSEGVAEPDALASPNTRRRAPVVVVELVFPLVTVGALEEREEEVRTRGRVDFEEGVAEMLDVRSREGRARGNLVLLAAAAGVDEVGRDDTRVRRDMERVMVLGVGP